jgi:hypothetical protein
MLAFASPHVTNLQKFSLDLHVYGGLYMLLAHSPSPGCQSGTQSFTRVSVCLPFVFVFEGQRKKDKAFNEITENI